MTAWGITIVRREGEGHQHQVRRSLSYLAPIDADAATRVKRPRAAVQSR